MQGQFWGASGAEGGGAERPNHSVGSLVRIASEDEVIRSFLGRAANLNSVGVTRFPLGNGRRMNTEHVKNGVDAAKCVTEIVVSYSFLRGHQSEKWNAFRFPV